MQSRIMELASQREFYIAMNTRLRQTLSDSSPSQIPNGIQTSSDGLPPSNPSLQLSSPDFHRSASGDRASLPSPSPSLPAPGSAGSLLKQDQESLLTAHFLASSLPPNYPTHSPHSHTPPQQQPHLPPQLSVPINAHHPSLSASGSPGPRQERQSVGTHEHTHHHHSNPAHHTENGHRSNPAHSGNAMATTGPPYIIPPGPEEMDTLIRAHQQSGH